MDAQHIQDIKQFVPQYLIVNSSEADYCGIDFLKLISVLYKKRFFIAIVTTLCTFLMIGYIFLSKPRYEINVNLFQPKSEQYQQLYLNTDSTLTQIQLFQQFLKKLADKNNIISFLNTNPLENKSEQKKIPASKINSEDSSNTFVIQPKALNITPIVNTFDNSLEAVLTFNTANSNYLQTKKILAYINYTNQQVLSDISNDQKAITQRKIKVLENEINHDLSKAKYIRNNLITRLENEQQIKIATLNNKINALRKTALRNREIRLEELENALKISQVLEKSRPNKIQKGGKKLLTNEMRNNEVLYLLGSNYLKNEIAHVKAKTYSSEFEKKVSLLEEELYIVKNNPNILNLSNRVDDKPYTKFLAEKQEQLNHLKSLTFDVNGLSCVYLNGTPELEKIPMKHSKLALIILSSVAGFMIAVCFILMQTIFQPQRHN